MFVSSASKRYYVPVERSSHVRRMSEYNPLYDTFQLDTTASQDQNQSDFQSMTPPKVRLMQNTLNNIDNTYDQPRSYRYNDDNEQRQHTSRQRQRSSCYQSKVGEIWAQKMHRSMHLILIIRILINDFSHRLQYFTHGYNYLHFLIT